MIIEKAALKFYHLVYIVFFRKKFQSLNASEEFRQLHLKL